MLFRSCTKTTYVGIIPRHHGSETVFDHEKFAKLIVQECISLFDGTKEMQTVGVLTHGQVIKQIKQHFKVES